MIEENKTTTGAATVSPPQRGFGDTSNQVRAKANDLKSAAGQIAEKSRRKTEAVWADARERARNFHEHSEQYVRKNPTKVILAALGIGIVVGLLYRRR